MGVGVFLLSSVLVLLKDIKFVKIDRAERKISWYSFYAPFGRRKKLHGNSGSYPTARLVDRVMHTALKINGLIYRNFDEIFATIHLPEIRKYTFNTLKYMLLVFTGRIKIKTNLTK